MTKRPFIAFILSLPPLISIAQNPGRLPHTARELEGISQHFTLIESTGQGATATRFLKQVEKQKIIHLATHAEVDTENPLNSALLFAEGEEGHTSVKVNELYNLDLQSELVVLSACNTGVGRETRGIGNMSIAHAFAVAGCPSTVLTQWQVDDAATSEIMETFYQELATKKNIGQSLRTAKLKYLQNSQKVRAAPFYWAGINVWGNTEGLKLKETRQWPYFLAGGTLLLLLSFFCIRRLKA